MTIYFKQTFDFELRLIIYFSSKAFVYSYLSKLKALNTNHSDSIIY
jgi:hypothetical protein